MANNINSQELLQEIAEAKSILAKEKIQLELKKEIDDLIKKGTEDALKEIRERIGIETSLTANSLKSEIENKTATALQEVANSSVEKTLKIIAEIRFWLATIIISLMVITGLVGWQFYDKMLKTVESRINGWLALDDGSPVKTKLEDIRTRSLLDAYLIRAARQVQGDRFSTSTMQLGAAEVKRLTLLLQDPDTTDIDFLDAAKVIAMTRGPIFGISPNPDLEKVVETVFSSNSFSNNKKYGLLTAWGNEISILPYAEEILKNDENPPKYFKDSAFRIVSRKNPELALSYAIKEIKKDKSDNTENLISFIALSNPRSADLIAWINNDGNKKSNTYPIALGLISQSLIKSAEKNSYFKTGDIEENAAKILATAISQGMYLEVISFSGRYSDIAFRSKGSPEVRSVEFIESFLKSTPVISKLFQKYTIDKKSLFNLTKSLQLVSENKYIAEILVDLSNGGELKLTDGSTISSQQTDDPVSIRADENEKVQTIFVKWKKKNGVYATGQLENIHQANLMKFSYSFDTETIGKLELRRNDAYFMN